MVTKQIRRQYIWSKLSQLAQFDVPDRFAPDIPKPVSQVVFAIFCACVSLVLRLLTDTMYPGAGPFALTVPATLVATLFGRWPSGMVCLVLSSLHAWYFVLPAEGSFAFVDPADGPRVAVNILSGFFVVMLAEIFRHTMRQAIADREMLLLEIEHRVKNNFASFAAILRMQANRAGDAQVRDELNKALGRVESYALANTMLYRNFENIGSVNMKTYLTELCKSLNDAIFQDPRIEMRCEAAPIYMPRDRAIIVGLLVNELATNSAKHAFRERDSGRIDVSFAEGEPGYVLTVSDDGVGMDAGTGRHSHGMTLIESLATQVKSSLSVSSAGTGTAFSFHLERD